MITFPFFDTVDAILTISSGSITVTKSKHTIRGEGNTDDTITTIAAASGMIGRVTLLERGGDEEITVSASVLNSATDFIFNHDDDQLLLRCTAVDTWKTLKAFSAGA